MFIETYFVAAECLDLVNNVTFSVTSLRDSKNVDLWQLIESKCVVFETVLKLYFFNFGQLL